jgi:4-amino-4-deoxy-L-arabinose transferase-like glycosyltransferase
MRARLTLLLQRPAPLFLLAIAVSLYRYAAWASTPDISLFSDEAQYWSWAQALDWGYYSKPPVIAAVIAFTTALAGSDAEWAIKLGPLLLYPLTTMLVYALGRRLYDPMVGRDAALLFLLMPALSMSAVIISTDVPLLLCWAAALLFLWRAREGDAWRDWLLTGFFAGLGLLTKYNMAFFAFALLAFAAADPRERRLLLNPRLYAAGLVALLVFLPNLWWNAQHEFITFRHHEEISGINRALFHPAELLEFFGAQFGMFGPLSFGLLLAAIARPRLWREARRETRFLLAFCAAPLLLILALALLTHAYANWGAPLYVAASILVAALYRQRRRWLGAALAVNLALGLAFYHYPALLRVADLPLQKRYDAYHRVRGWDALGIQVQQRLQQYPDARLLSSDRKILAQLLYYARPLQDPRIWAPPDRRPASHYHMTLPLQADDAGVFLWIVARAPAAGDLARFEHAQRRDDLVVQPYPGLERRYQVWQVDGFRGYAAAP